MRTTSGVAIILVLISLVLISVVAVSFLSGGRGERMSSRNAAIQEQLRGLAALPVALVEGQIRDATLENAGTHAWASQPGAIRKWDEEGKLHRVYKLYSSLDMQSETLDFLDEEEPQVDLPADWAGRTTEFTDLNEPVAVPEAGGERWVYPILDPAALGNVDSFSSVLPQRSDTAWDDRAVMPVRWLYVTRDGAIGAPSIAGADNPIVGRIAFWTDDESAKVNINTASASTINPVSSYLSSESFWDTPIAYGMAESNFGRAIPAQGEFQRMSAHPASVNLLRIFKGASLQEVIDLTPRYRWGGSENGTRGHAYNRIPLTGADASKERLYASVDELIFTPLLNEGVRVENALPAAPGQPLPRKIDQWRFFLTSSSRSPDLNLWGRPRVALWPISGNNDENHRTIFDQLIARCATLGSLSDPDRHEYFFQRLNPLSQTEDWDHFPRNQTLFAYLRALTASEIPGFGGNFKQKYDVQSGGVSGETDQILTQLFDYIRCANLNETYSGIGESFQSYTPPIIAPDPTPPNFLNSYTFPGAGFVVPISIAAYNTRGAGRVPTLSEAAVVLLQRAAAPLPSDPDTPVAGNLVQSGLFLETFSPMCGYMPWFARGFNLAVTCSALLNGEEIYPGQNQERLAFPAPGLDASPMSRGAGGSSTGGADGYTWILPERLKTFNYPFARLGTNPIAAPSPTMTLSQGDLVVKLSVGGQTYQTLHLEIPSAVLLRPEPGPEPAASVSPTQRNAPTYDWTSRRTNAGQRIYPQDVVHSVLLRDGDYRIAAYLPEVPKEFFRAHRDFGTNQHFAHSLRRTRFMTARGATQGKFVPVHYGEGEGVYGHSDEFPATLAPKIDPRITDLHGGENWEGDWDTGISIFPDGAYLNKPDEGFVDPRGLTPAYFKDTEWDRAIGYFSPTRQLPSAVMFGSLPTAVKRTYRAYSNGDYSSGRPWRTLLFCPNPIAKASHYGFEAPADHLLLDLFNQPVVEPYAISEPFSTAGRVNLNSQLLPFTGIKRQTALHAVLDSQRVTAIPNAAAPFYKNNTQTPSENATRYRLPINAPETLRQLDQRFAPDDKPQEGDLFRSASEICRLFLVPETASSSPTLATVASWWDDYLLTGDNLRERPYATLYPLLTTKSNVYTVHFRVQAIQKVPSTSPGNFVEGRDAIAGEYRGSVTIERYIDPADPRLTAMKPDEESLESLYRYRIIETKPFAP